MPTTTLKNQTAVVTGASGGIGGAIATALAQQGATLCVLGRDEIKLENAAVFWRTGSPCVEVYRCDLTMDSDIADLCNQVCRKHERIDILVHSAGVIDHGKLADAPVACLDHQYNVNVRGALTLTRKLLPLLKKPRGQIVFINSSAGLTTAVDRGHLSATRFALRALADTLREEVNGEGVRVLSVFPGRTATSTMQALHEKEGRAYRPELLLQPEDVASVVVNALTLPWTAEVTNISIRSMQKSY